LMRTPSRHIIHTGMNAWGEKNFTPSDTKEVENWFFRRYLKLANVIEQK